MDADHFGSFFVFNYQFITIILHVFTAAQIDKNLRKRHVTSDDSITSVDVGRPFSIHENI